MNSAKGRKTIIKKCVEAYPGRGLLDVNIDAFTVPELVQAAKAGSFGDTLLSFLILELYEGLENEAKPAARAVELLDRALLDLLTVRQALLKLEAKHQLPALKPFLYACVIVRSGIIVSLSLHTTADEAIHEAQFCGDNDFRPDYDDIAVFELNLEGSCEDRIYTYEQPFEEEPAHE